MRVTAVCSEQSCDSHSAGGCPLASKLPLDGVSAWGALTTGKGSRPEDSKSNRSDIYHDICLAWMGGSCLERLDQEGGPFKEGAIFASMMRGNWKLMIGQNKNVSTASDAAATTSSCLPRDLFLRNSEEKSEVPVLLV